LKTQTNTFIFRAEAETKAKLEKVAEIKKNNAIMMAIKSDISKHEETLKVLFKSHLFFFK